MFQVFTGHTGWLLGQTRISLTPILSGVIKLYTNISQTVHFGEPTENSCIQTISISFTLGLT